MTKGQVDKMLSCQNGKLAKCTLDSKEIWRNVKLTKCQVDKM